MICVYSISVDLDLRNSISSGPIFLFITVAFFVNFISIDFIYTQNFAIVDCAVFSFTCVSEHFTIRFTIACVQFRFFNGFSFSECSTINLQSVIYFSFASVSNETTISYAYLTLFNRFALSENRTKRLFYLKTINWIELCSKP